jgi:para-nitrobenzyl esterase
MCIPALAAESGNLCGNYGQLDLIASLQWVQRNIAAFGGDPRNVTIWGESGGGEKVLGLMASPLAKRLFNRVICESGGVGSVPLATAEALGSALTTKLEVSDLASLRALTWENIITAVPGSGYTDAFTVDGYFLPDLQTNIFATDRQNDVPLMIGMNGEDITFVFSGTQALVPIIKQKSPIFVYLFDHVPDGWKSLPAAEAVNHAFHGLDVAYEFGFYPWVSAFVDTLFFPPFPPTTNPGLDQKDTYVSEAMMTMWTRFAATGNPSVKHLINWPAYAPPPNTDQYLLIDDPLQVLSGFTTLVEPTANHWGL